MWHLCIHGIQIFGFGRWRSAEVRAEGVKAGPAGAGLFSYGEGGDDGRGGVVHCGEGIVNECNVGQKETCQFSGNKDFRFHELIDTYFKSP